MLNRMQIEEVVLKTWPYAGTPFARLVNHPEPGIDGGEPTTAGVVIVLTIANGVASEYTTNGIDEPLCFDSLELDTYYLTVTPPPGYKLSPPGGDAWEIRLGAQRAHVRFGFRTVQRVQYSTPVGASTGTSEQGTRSVSLALWMVLLIVGGVIAGGGVLGRRAFRCVGHCHSR